MPHPWRTAPLQPVDLSACLALDRQALGGFWSEEQWRRELEDDQRPGVGLHRDAGLVALASSWLVVDELHITLVAVDPRQRRCGLGGAVLRSLLERGRQLGAGRATLEVAAGNAAALALYAGCGFETAGIRRGYYRSGEDALIQWRNL
jgi:ribosomal-protein-alanine N-acetyltransferase